jgi:hypothetical protein
MSGVPWWYVPEGGVRPRPGVDSTLLREPDWNDIRCNELRLKANRDGIFDEDRILFRHEPADFSQVTIARQALDEFVRDLLAIEVPRAPVAKVARAFTKSAARHVQAQTRPTRSEHIRELRQELPGMTEDQYDDAKKQAIKDGILPPEWARAGRPKIAVKSSAP